MKRAELFHMYDYTYENADTNYTGYRNNPFKHFIRKTGVLDTRPAEHEYLAGDYSIADIANWAWVRTHKWSGVEVEGLPNLQRWMSQLESRPACQRGVEVPPRPARIEDGKGTEKFIEEARKPGGDGGAEGLSRSHPPRLRPGPKATPDQRAPGR